MLYLHGGIAIFTTIQDLFMSSTSALDLFLHRFVLIGWSCVRVFVWEFFTDCLLCESLQAVQCGLLCCCHCVVWLMSSLRTARDTGGVMPCDININMFQCFYYVGRQTALLICLGRELSTAL